MPENKKNMLALVIKKASEENGRMIVSGINNPESVPQVIEKNRTRSAHERTHAKVEASKLSAEEKQRFAMTNTNPSFWKIPEAAL